jgi:hypothetical protein
MRMKAGRSRTGVSPKLNFVIPSDLLHKWEQIAEREGKTLSELTRTAIVEYAERHSIEGSELNGRNEVPPIS